MACLKIRSAALATALGPCRGLPLRMAALVASCIFGASAALSLVVVLDRWSRSRWRELYLPPGAAAMPDRNIELGDVREPQSSRGINIDDGAWTDGGGNVVSMEI